MHFAFGREKTGLPVRVCRAGIRFSTKMQGVFCRKINYFVEFFGKTLLFQIILLYLHYKIRVAVMQCISGSCSKRISDDNIGMKNV